MSETPPVENVQNKAQRRRRTFAAINRRRSSLNELQPVSRTQSALATPAGETPQRFFQQDDNEKSNPDLKLRLHDTNAIDPPRDPEPLTAGVSKKGGEKSWFASALDFLRPYYILDYLDANSSRIVLRTWLKAWVCAVFTLIGPVDRWLGMAAYLMTIYSFVAPCGNFSISQSIQFGVICVVGACIGWLHSVIAMAISVRIRGNHDMVYYTQSLIEEGVCRANDPNLSNCVTQAIYHGHFLTTKTSVIHAFAMVIGLTLMIYIKLKHHPIMFVGIVGTISLMITVSYGVLQPTFVPWQLGQVVIKPMGVTFAMNIVFSVLIFPKTSSFNYFDGNYKILRALHGMCKLHLSILKSESPSKSEFNAYKKLPQTVGALKAKIALLQAELVPLTWEVSYGRLDKAVALRFTQLMTHLMDRLQGFEIVYEYLHDQRLELLQEEEGKEKESEPSGTIIGQYEHQQRQKFHEIARGSITMEDLDWIVATMYELFGPVMTAADEAFDSTLKWLDCANNQRGYCLYIPSQRKKYAKLQKECATNLVTSLKHMNETLQSVVDKGEWEEELKAKVSQLSHPSASAELTSQCCMFGFLVRQYVQSLERLMVLFITVDEQRPRPQFIWYWTPRITVPVNDDVHNKVAPEHVQVDPEALPPSNGLQKFGMLISRFYHEVLGDKIFITSFRAACFVLMATVPVFCKTTAWWFYSNRLVWATIMTALGTFAWFGETVYAFIADSSFTFLACVLALVSWYIGNGSGPGNPYGQGAVYAVVFLFLTYYRHFSQHFLPLPAILFAVTYCLVTGTSWQDTHIVQPANVGYGWEPVWKRFVTVFAGLFIGTLGSLLPKPYTVKKAIRVNLGTILTEIGSLHTDIGNFAVNRARDAQTHVLLGGRDHVLQRVTRIRALLGDTRRKCRAVKFEPPLQGTWPKDNYLRLLKLQADVVLLYSYLYAVFNNLSDPHRRVCDMVNDFGWTDTALNSDFLAILHMCGASLVMRHPLPMLTPAQTTIKHMELMEARNVLHPATFDFSMDGKLTLTGRYLMRCIYSKVDEIGLITKELVGEEYQIDKFYFQPFKNSEEQLALLSNAV